MRLTVIIVNYNVKYFLEQCLASVHAAMRGIEVEVIVVDNNSVDGSNEMVEEKFPWVNLIANKDNTGFSKANNQGMRIAKGEYILLLNPDTVVKEDTFSKVLHFMDAHPEAGGLGVPMVDGKGILLPESKRGLPTPETSFYKIFGISKLFPKSKKFNRYYLGHLSYDETCEIEILAGAFMFMRKKALDQVGLLDEAFFMYGEDIDLSWRIIQGGWKNYYFPETSIIHYKGESTKKGSLNYVYVFYNAMIIFARKHFSASHAKWFSFFIQVAVWMRASVSIVSRVVTASLLPLADAAVLSLGIYTFADHYSQWQSKNFDGSLMLITASVITAFTLIGNWLNGAYDRPVFPQRTLKPVLLVSIITLLIYSLLPETIRFSRIVILLSSLFAIVSLPLVHAVFNKIISGKWNWQGNPKKRILLIGSEEEGMRVQTFLHQIDYPIASFEQMNSEKSRSLSLFEYVRIHKIQEVIFCAKDLSSSEIISEMGALSSLQLEFKIAPPESLFIIGSQHIQSATEGFFVTVNSISNTLNKRQKRAFDLISSFFTLVLFPSILFTSKPLSAFTNGLKVFVGKKSWVGYGKVSAEFASQLPKIKSGILTPNKNAMVLNEDGVQQMNAIYAKDYSWWKDLKSFTSQFKQIGN